MGGIFSRMIGDFVNRMRSLHRKVQKNVPGPVTPAVKEKEEPVDATLKASKRRIEDEDVENVGDDHTNTSKPLKIEEKTGEKKDGNKTARMEDIEEDEEKSGSEASVVAL